MPKQLITRSTVLAYIGKKYWLPLLIVAFAVVLSLLSTTFLDVTLPNRLQDFITLSLSVFVEAFPFLVLGASLAVLVRTFVPPSLFHRILPKHGVPRRGILSLLGFMFPVCECGNVPLARSLLLQKLSVADAVTFLLAAPVINPITLWATHEAFGFDNSIVATRFIATFLIANIVGFVIALRKDQQSYLSESFKKESHQHRDDSDIPAKIKLKTIPSQFSSEALLMMKMLAFGAMVAGAVQTFVPRDVLTSIGSDVILSIAAMLLLAFVISICANVDAFFALAFSNTFTAGSIVSFLVFGPMIDIKMLALMKTTFKTELLVILTSVVTVLSVLTGLVFTYAL